MDTQHHYFVYLLSIVQLVIMLIILQSLVYNNAQELMLIQIVNHACSNAPLSTQQLYFTLILGIEYVQPLAQILPILILFAMISIKHVCLNALQGYSWIHF